MKSVKQEIRKQLEELFDRERSSCNVSINTYENLLEQDEYRKVPHKRFFLVRELERSHYLKMLTETVFDPFTFQQPPTALDLSSAKHELAHAYVFWIFDVPIDCIRFVTIGEGGGFIHFLKAMNPLIILLCSLAGFVFDDPHADPAGSRFDLEDAKKELREVILLGAEEEEITKALTRFGGIAKLIVDAGRPVIEKVAEALAVRKKMTYGEVVKYFEEEEK